MASQHEIRGDSNRRCIAASHLSGNSRHFHQVLADLGMVAVLMRLVTKLFDDNFFASTFANFAGFLPDYKEQSAKVKFGKKAKGK